MVLVEEGKEYLKVIKIRPLFPLTYVPVPPMLDPRLINPALLASASKPILEFLLEDGKIFRMSGIPVHIALEIWDLLEKKKKGHSFDSIDPRLTLSQLVTEIADVKNVKIVDLIPDLNVFVAEIELLPEGFDHPVKFQMIPSHAIVIALRANADIYVSRDLLEEIEEESKEDREAEGFYEI